MRLEFSVCRSHVLPCQKEISIPVGGSRSMDLVVETRSLARLTPLLAWETHLRFTNSAAAFSCGVHSRGHPPVQTLPWWGDDWEAEDFYNPQNVCAPDSGGLDYSFLSLERGSGDTARAVPLTLNQNRTVLGTTVIHGQTPGLAHLVSQDADENPARMVHLDALGQVVSTALRLPKDHLASVVVGPVRTTGISVFLTAPAWAAGGHHDTFPDTVTMTLWRAGDEPRWLDGREEPMVTLTQVPVDETGSATVEDLPPSLVSPGKYDLRVNADGATTEVLTGLTFPEPGDTRHTVTAVVPPLRYGDLDGDNMVNHHDLRLFQAAYGNMTKPGSSHHPADFNRDHIVDVTDFSIMALNYGSRGK